MRARVSEIHLPEGGIKPQVGAFSAPMRAGRSMPRLFASLSTMAVLRTQHATYGPYCPVVCQTRRICDCHWPRRVLNLL